MRFHHEHYIDLKVKKLIGKKMDLEKEIRWIDEELKVLREITDDLQKIDVFANVEKSEVTVVVDNLNDERVATIRKNMVPQKSVQEGCGKKFQLDDGIPVTCSFVKGDCTRSLCDDCRKLEQNAPKEKEQ